MKKYFFGFILFITALGFPNECFSTIGYLIEQISESSEGKPLPFHVIHIQAYHCRSIEFDSFIESIETSNPEIVIVQGDLEEPEAEALHDYLKEKYPLCVNYSTIKDQSTIIEQLLSQDLWICSRISYDNATFTKMHDSEDGFFNCNLINDNGEVLECIYVPLLQFNGDSTEDYVNRIIKLRLHLIGYYKDLDPDLSYITTDDFNGDFNGDFYDYDDILDDSFVMKGINEETF